MDKWTFTLSLPWVILKVLSWCVVITTLISEVDTLRRQLKANEESYMALRAMYEELRDAATGLVSHIRTNTFAN